MPARLARLLVPVLRLVPLLLLGLAVPAWAAEPPVLALQGVLRTAAGTPVADGDYAMAIAVHDAAVGGNVLFEEAFLAVAVQGGLFAVDVGTKKAKLDPAWFDGAPRWLGITVGKEPELPRSPLRPVPYAIGAGSAGVAHGLACSGCVDSAALAPAAVTAAHLAAGAVQPQHVAFAYAAADTKGGPALQAKQADQAKVAAVATSAEEAQFAAVAGKLQCTGCVGAGHLADDAVAGLVAAGKLAKVAQTGAYADLAGGPDLSGLGALGGDNTWTGKQTFGGDATFAKPVQFGKQQALLFRVQNATQPPAACDANAIGLIWYDTAKDELVVCNGKQWLAFAKVGQLGTEGNPAGSCKALATAGVVQDGAYWLKPDGAPAFQAWCDLQGGGWTLVMKLASQSAFVYAHAVWSATDGGGGQVPTPAADADLVSPAFYRLAGSETRACLHRFGDGKVVCEVLSHPPQTARALANGPVLSSSQGTNGKLPAAWQAIVQGGQWGAHAWHRWGWHHGTEGCGGLRLGFSADNDSSDSRDSGIGIGVYKGGCQNELPYGAGWWHYPGWSPKPNPVAAPSQGYVWLR